MISYNQYSILIDTKKRLAKTLVSIIMKCIEVQVTLKHRFTIWRSTVGDVDSRKINEPLLGSGILITTIFAVERDQAKSLEKLTIRGSVLKVQVSRNIFDNIH